MSIDPRATALKAARGWRTKVTDLCDELSIPWYCDLPPYGQPIYRANGPIYVPYLGHIPTDPPTCLTAHELAHYLVATPQERATNNFGFSTDWRNGGEIVAETNQQAVQERLAYHLGVEISRYLGIEDKAVRYYDEHSMFRIHHPMYREVLYRDRLLDSEGRFHPNLASLKLRGTEDQQKVSRLCRVLGVPSFIEQPDFSERTAMYDEQKGVYIPPDSNPSHELAHWLVATPEQRALQNFGLGHDWLGGGSAWLERYQNVRDVQESLASALGILIDWALGVGAPMESFRDQGWKRDPHYHEGLRSWREVKSTLYGIGLLNERLRYTVPDTYYA